MTPLFRWGASAEIGVGLAEERSPMGGTRLSTVDKRPAALH
jgi:hypothetical protein